MTTTGSGSRLDSDSEFAGYDGSSSMDTARTYGWKVLGGWGADGWDLGSWPYQFFAIKDAGGRFYLVQYTEGDTDIVSFSTAKARSTEIDRMARAQWEGDESMREEMATRPASDFTGPYRG